MFRSECGPIPVSTIATSASTRSSIPLIFDSAEVGVPIRGDAGRHRLRLDLDDLVGYDGGDVRVGEHCGPLRLVELGREATERVPEGAVGDRPLAFCGGRSRRSSGSALPFRHHEVVARSDRPALAIDRDGRRLHGSLGPGSLRGRRRRRRGDRRARCWRRCDRRVGFGRRRRARGGIARRRLRRGRRLRARDRGGRDRVDGR
jgi:hypothetical protein